MPNSYRVSIRVVPIINAGPESSSGYGLQNGLELKQDGQRLLNHCALQFTRRLFRILHGQRGEAGQSRWMAPNQVR